MVLAERERKNEVAFRRSDIGWRSLVVGPAGSVDAPDKGLKSVLEAQPEKSPEPVWKAMPDESSYDLAEPVRMDQSQD